MSATIDRWPDLLTDEEVGLLTPDELAAYGDYLQRELQREIDGTAVLEADPYRWLRAMFPDSVTAPFAEHHDTLWSWVWAIQAGTKPEQAFVAVWPRGGAKSTSAELAVAALGARRRRRYTLYVCDTQDQADEHVANIATLLESAAIAERYPDLGERRVGKFGNSRGWRRNRLATASGLVVDALGLDTAARGVKFDDQRPDLLVLDDIDDEQDSAQVANRKVGRITKKLLPAGANHLAVLAIQNLVHPEGVFARLVDGRADFLRPRVVSGPVPAVEGLVVTEDAEHECWRVVAGEPTWQGQDLVTVEAQINEWGLGAFLAEAQHDVLDPKGGMWDHVTFAHCTRGEVPELVRTTVWVDPAVTNTDDSDAHGIQCDGLGVDGVIYRLHSWESRTTPEDSLRRAIRVAIHYGSLTVGVETDQGGDTWESTFRAAAEQVAREDEVPLALIPSFKADKAGAGHGPKVHRSSQMLSDYDRPGRRIVHVLDGGHPLEVGCAILERALRRFPKVKPYDLADAAYWSWQDIRAAAPARSGARTLLGARVPSTAGTAAMARRQSSPMLRRIR